MTIQRIFKETNRQLMQIYNNETLQNYTNNIYTAYVDKQILENYLNNQEGFNF